MDMRHARFDDVPALVAFDGTITRPEWQRVLQDPWVTVTIGADEAGWCGWITYTVDELRQLVVRRDLWGGDAVAEFYGEAYRHWRTAATETARSWVAEDDPAGAYLSGEGWRPTGRRRRIPTRPGMFLTELMLELPPSRR